MTDTASPVEPTERAGLAARRFWLFVGIAAVVGLVLRVAWVIWATEEPASLYDPARYLGYAREIAKGNGYTQVDLKSLAEGTTPHDYATAYYPPGYPWFLGIVAWLSKPFTDDLPIVIGIVQALIGSATAVVGAIVARRIAGPIAGIVAAVWLALYPNLVFHTGVILGETLYNALFMAFLAVLLWRPWADGLPPRRVLASGVLLGLAVMVRPISLAVIPVVVLAWWSHRRSLRTGGVGAPPATVEHDGDDERDEDDVAVEAAPTFPVLKPAALLVVGVLACILPWTARNAVRMDAFVLISTNTGDNLCMGHGEHATGAFRSVDPDDPCFPDHDPRDGTADEVAADKEKTSAAISETLANLDREPWLTWRRFYFMWVRDGDHDAVFAAQSYRVDRQFSHDAEARLLRIADVGYWITCAFGVVGLVLLAVRRRAVDLLLLGCALMTAAVPLAFFGDSRFKVPVIPLLIIAAACLFRAGGRSVLLRRSNAHDR